MIDFENLKKEFNRFIIDQKKSEQVKKLEDLDLHKSIKEFFEIKSIKLYKHQYNFFLDLLKNKHNNNYIISTSTSSGKSLIYQISTIQYKKEYEKSFTLYIGNRNSLLKDQFEKLYEYYVHFDIETIIYTGNIVGKNGKLKEFNDEEFDQFKKLTRDEFIKLKNNKIGFLLTSIDFLSKSFIQHHNFLGNEFWKNVKNIVIDEFHEYTGIFGSEFIFTIRRLRTILEKYGNNNYKFIINSATISNVEDISTIFQTTFINIDKDYSFSNKKNFFIPKIEYFENKNLFNKNKTNLINILEYELTSNNNRIIVFFNSISLIKNLYFDILKSKNKVLEKEITYFIANDKNKYKNIKEFIEGKKRVIFSTNALESGIDIKGIGTVIIFGFPSKTSYFNQRIGRAGRENIKYVDYWFLPNKNFLDYYYCTNPNSLINGTINSLIQNIQNKQLINKHKILLDYEISKFKKNDDIFNQKDLYFNDKKINKKNINELYNIRYIDNKNVSVIKNGETIEKVPSYSANQNLTFGSIYKNLYDNKEYFINDDFNKGNNIILKEVVSNDLTLKKYIELLSKNNTIFFLSNYKNEIIDLNKIDTEEFIFVKKINNVKTEDVEKEMQEIIYFNELKVYKSTNDINKSIETCSIEFKNVLSDKKTNNKSSIFLNIDYKENNLLYNSQIKETTCVSFITPDYVFDIFKIISFIEYFEKYFILGDIEELEKKIDFIEIKNFFYKNIFVKETYEEMIEFLLSKTKEGIFSFITKDLLILVQKFNDIIQSLKLEINIEQIYLKTFITRNEIENLYNIDFKKYKILLEKSEFLPNAVHSLEHIMIKLSTKFNIDDNEIGGISSTQKIIFYDGYDYGFNLTDYIFDNFKEIIKDSMYLSKNCNCKEERGCDICTLSYNCGNGNKFLNKRMSYIFSFILYKYIKK